jgi:hypothetical protein
MEVNSTISKEPVKRHSPPPTSRADGRKVSEESSHDYQIPQADSRVPPHKATSGQQPLATATSLQPSIDYQARALHWLANEATQQPETGPISQDELRAALMAELEVIYAYLAKFGSNLATEAYIITPCVKSSSEDFEFLRWIEKKEIEPNTLKDDLSQSEMREGLRTQRPRQDFSGHNQSHNLEFKSFARKISSHCRTWRRLSDRSLHLLRREQHLASSQQWMEVMRLSSSLIHLLNENESTLANADTALLGALAQVEAILNRLKLRFRRIYAKLKQKDGLAQAVFEFPNNFRHLCTTMPWTIAPALLVLWGVCWMFFGSPSPPHKKPVAAGPVTSTSPVLYDFLEGCPSTDASGKPNVRYIHSSSNPW